MKWLIRIVLSLVIAAGTLHAQTAGPLKIYISVDMDGLGGVTNPQDVGGKDEDFPAFRREMTREVNAAVEACLAAGAKEIVVEEHHGVRGFRNILLDELNPNVHLIRGWPRPQAGVTGLHVGFNAAMFIGYHARAGTPNALLAHTFLLQVADFRINGRSVGEGEFNAIIAAAYGVPVILVSGDDVAADQMKSFLGNVETVVVKRSLSSTAGVVVPFSVSIAEVKKGATDALQHLADFYPVNFPPPYRAEITFKPDWDARIEPTLLQHPELVRLGPRTVGRTCKDANELLDFYMAALNLGGDAPASESASASPDSPHN